MNKLEAGLNLTEEGAQPPLGPPGYGPVRHCLIYPPEVFRWLDGNEWASVAFQKYKLSGFLMLLLQHVPQ